MKEPKDVKVLVVGAGGIGCELLKNLVLSGFHNLEVIDLDTIDVSNLNRQFLFRKHHVGLSKAVVAAEAVKAYAPGVKIIAHHKTVFASEFGVDFIKGFDLVANALDNLKARRHVNRLCLAADVPLIESGTAGYLGQTTVIRKGKTECFECVPKPTPKTFPVCTIRTTPSAPIHCVVWAKDHVFRRLFSAPEDLGESDSGTESDSESEGEGAGGKDGSKGETVTRVAPTTKKPLRSYTAEELFDRLFCEDIQTLLSMHDLWVERRPPTPLRLSEVVADGGQPSGEEGTSLSFPEGRRGGERQHLLVDQRVWSPSECAAIFVDRVKRLRSRMSSNGSSIPFDKDDDECMDLVTAATSLRARAFSIEPQSRFDVKAKAGNIIPAIATTNAVIAGLIVVEALKLIEGRPQDCRTTYLLRRPNGRRRLLLPVKLCSPNPSCYVCQRAFVAMKLNTKTTTLGFLVNKVLKQELGFNDPDVAVGHSVWYESVVGQGEEDDEEVIAMKANLLRPLADIRIGHNTVVTVSDFSQDLSCNITIVHVDELEDGASFELSGDRPSTTTTTASTTTTTTTTATTTTTVAASLPSSTTTTTAAASGAEEAVTSRKRKASEVDSDLEEVMVVDGSEKGSEPPAKKKARVEVDTSKVLPQGLSADDCIELD